MNRLLLSGDLYQNRTVLQHRRKLPISPGFSESRAVEKSLSESEIDSAGLCFLFFFAFAWGLFPRDNGKPIGGHLSRSEQAISHGLGTPVSEFSQVSVSYLGIFEHKAFHFRHRQILDKPDHIPLAHTVVRTI